MGLVVTNTSLSSTTCRSDWSADEHESGYKYAMQRNRLLWTAVLLLYISEHGISASRSLPTNPSPAAACFCLALCLEQKAVWHCPIRTCERKPMEGEASLSLQSRQGVLGAVHEGAHPPAAAKHREHSRPAALFGGQRCPSHFAAARMRCPGGTSPAHCYQAPRPRPLSGRRSAPSGCSLRASTAHPGG